MPELYFLLLVSVLTADDATQAQWRHLYRTAAGAGYEADVRDLLPDAYSLTDAKLIEAVDSIERDALVNAFVLDCILLALLHEGDDSAILAYIAGLFALFGTEQAVIRETIQAAKIILAQDREAYLAAMTEMEYLAARESCCYLFHADAMTVTNDLAQPEAVTSQHLVIVGVEETNIKLDLDTWQAGKITFRDCSFENSEITSSVTEVHFTGCTFYEKGGNAGNTELWLQESSSFKQCTFKNIVYSKGGLSLYNAEISHCIFLDCSVRSCNLINLNVGTITDSEFIRCHNDDNFYLFCISQTSILRCSFSDCYGQPTALLKLSDSTITNSTFMRCHCDNNKSPFNYEYMVFVRNAFVRQCCFTNCKANFNGSGGSIIYAEETSAIEYCCFKQCEAKSGYSTSKCMIYIKEPSTATNNTFTDCSCWRHIV